MRRSIRIVPVLVCLVALCSRPGLAQAQTPKPEPTYRDVLLKQWTDIGEKVVKMAEEFPEDKYEFRPVPGVRTFGDQTASRGVLERLRRQDRRAGRSRTAR